MYTLNTSTQLNWGFKQLPSATQAYRLSPMARYYICRLLRQIADTESAEFLVDKLKLSSDHCMLPDEILKQNYSDEVELAQVILQLENLVHFYMTFNLQSSHYVESNTQLTQIKQTILQLLGLIKPAV